MGIYFDKRVEELGGKRVFERGEGDADKSIEEDFEDWKSKMLPALAEEFGTTVEEGDEKVYVFLCIINIHF